MLLGALKARIGPSKSDIFCYLLFVIFLVRDFGPPPKKTVNQIR